MQKLRNFGHWLQERWLETILVLGFLALLAWFGTVGYAFWPELKPLVMPATKSLSGDTAYGHVIAQTDFGPRTTGSEGNRAAGEYIIDTLETSGWLVETQEFTYRDTAARNIIGKAGSGPVVIIGAHYDTRARADRDPNPDLQSEPVPGANDGASGTAVLLELARALDLQQVPYEVWLVFFDAEDNGGLDDWEFIAGSRYMADNLTITPEFVIVADMIGDADQQIYRERNSESPLQDRIWQIASDLGYSDYFIDEFKWTILDDHIPFLELGIASVDIIDFDYPSWHTTQDTVDKVSPAALERVGRVIQVLLEGEPFQGE